MTKNIVIMAKSKKYNNYCIAGFDTGNRQWVRLVSDDESIKRAVPVDFAKYSDGTEVEVLDVVRVHIVENAEVTTAAQSENVLYDKNFIWEKTGRMSVEEVIENFGREASQYIFVNKRKELTEEEVDGHSLTFIKAVRPTLYINKYRRNDHVEKIELRISFNYNDWYSLPVTDLKFEKKYKTIFEETGTEQFYLGDSLNLVVSLGYFEDKELYYKLVATVFEGDQYAATHPFDVQC